MSKSHERAAKARARIVELYQACKCEWPSHVLRNAHGHGKTEDGKPCPAIEIWKRHRAEDE